MMTPLDRFWAKVDISAGPYGCWIWTASRSPFGHGSFRADGRTQQSQRWLLGHLRGRPLEWSERVKEAALHKCDNPPCCNPTHLYIGTQQQNIHDRVERGRGRSGIRNTEKTHCPRGHPYDAANTRIGSRGSRNCRACARMWAADRKAALREVQ